ncbi:MAG: hypothetical protein Q7K16_02525 [Candidatus Azambacteria bacterium]|nr:hypothetical protein [Candidatus Azambacteria bacterium]
MWQFIEQYKRMERWHERLEITCSRIPDGFGPLEELDDVLAFFQNCYHLKDWVKNDDSSGIPGIDVENFVNNSEFLKVCGDLCNGSKHLKITKPKTHGDTKINRHVYLRHGGHVNDPIVKREFIIKSGENKYEALDLANKCIKEWKKFFNDKGFSWS